MAVDLSLLENINFANRDNLIFLAIIFILAIIVFSLFFIITVGIIKRIRRTFTGVALGRVRKPKNGQTGSIQQPADVSGQDNSHRVESYGNVGGGSAMAGKKEAKKETKKEYKQSYEAKEQKEISEGLSKLKTASSGEGTLDSKMPSREEKKRGSKGEFYAENSSQSSTESRDLTGQKEADHRGIKIPTVQNFKEASSSEKITAGEKPGIDQAYKQKYEVKEKNDIAAGLSKLKSVAPSKEGTVSSKMPFRDGAQEENDHQQINIPVSKRFKDADYVPDSGENSQQTGNGQGARASASSPFEKPVFMEDKYGAHSDHGDISKVSPQSKSEQGKPIFEKPGFMEDKSGFKAGNKSKINQQNSDDSIFEGESEISRIKLESEMKSDPKVWQASKQAGLNMSPVERSKLVKEIFPSALGRNISKSDIKTSIRSLNKKLSGAQDPTEHGKIRKEIKFLKKIGGIK